MRDYLMLFLIRFVLLVGVVAVVWWVSGGPGLINTILAIVISSLLSFVLLGTMRERIAASTADYLAQRREKKQAARKAAGRSTEEELEDRDVERGA
ncbi:DUF4229 domain-containing protein [Brevibacterium samyangense]|uniref:DUF4229 domain-containing protein n=1 Tax=Brevibacterium samyangense TaxID=366888 RepID=A0ABP5EWB8_9MICO